MEANGTEAKRLAERLRNAVASFHVPAISDFVLTVSIGIATKTDDHATLDSLLASADIALYQAKHEGRNRVCVYKPETD